MTGEMTVKEMGHRGGTSTVAKYPADTRRKWSVKGGQTTKEKYGVEHYRELKRLSDEAKKVKKLALDR